MPYTEPHLLTEPVGNNAFAYQVRQKKHGDATLSLPTLKTVERLDQIELGDHIVFEETDPSGKLTSCTGLKHIYHLDQISNGQSCYLMDTHNHALYFWLTHTTKELPQQITLVHIDQHSDLNKPSSTIDTSQLTDPDYCYRYTNNVCNIGNFIPPFLDAYPQTNFHRVKSEHDLLSTDRDSIFSRRTDQHQLIVDIDLDFRAPEMSIDRYAETCEKVGLLLQKADLITIATSPFFIDQDKALAVLHDLFD